MRASDLLKIELIFSVCGAVASTLFVALVSRSVDSEFWFITGTKYRIPRLTYWAGFGLLLTLGILVGYFTSILVGWLTNLGRSAIPRQILAALIFAGSFPLGYIASIVLIEVLDPMLDYILAWVVIVVVISCGLWLFTGKWKASLSIFLFLALPLSYFFTITAYKLFNLSAFAYDISQMGFLGSLLCGICGYWFTISMNRRS